MPRPLQVKIFMDSQPSVIEGQINAWLTSQTSVSIIKTETAISAGAGNPGGTGSPWLVVTIWFEPPPPDRERPGFRVV
jgi:hypothetical protein